MAKKNNAEPKQRTRVRTLFKWIRRISMLAAIMGAVRKVAMDQNEAKPPAV